MSFTMYIGMITGMLTGGLAVAIALLIAKKKGVPSMVEDDERTELIKARAGNLAFGAITIVAFVGWVVDNIMRHLKDQPVAFFSPWSIIFFLIIVVYLAAYYYEAWKVSDNDAVPGDGEMKKMQAAMLAMGGSLLALISAMASAGDRVDPAIRNFLLGFEGLLALTIIGMFGRMYLKRKSS